jgi:hypothetical protein
MAQGPDAGLDAPGAEIARLRATSDQVGACVFTNDLQGRYTFANAMVCHSLVDICMKARERRHLCMNLQTAAMFGISQA